MGLLFFLLFEFCQAGYAARRANHHTEIESHLNC